VINPSRRTKNFEILNMLLEKADVQGYLTTEDLIEVYPEIGGDSERMEAIMVALRRRGVDIVDPDGMGGYSDSEADPNLTDEGDSFADLAAISSDDTIGLYLKEMSRVPLLSMPEELDLAKRIERGRAAKKEIDCSNESCSSQQKEDLNLLVEDGITAREHLIKANTRLVVSVAKRYMGRGVHFLDLIQEGNLGLMKAVEKFEYQRGFRFSTYATSQGGGHGCLQVSHPLQTVGDECFGRT
jgi:RNA polymerase primary sigma factor